MAVNNNIDLITKYSPKAWDAVYKQESMSSLLDADSRLVQFTGAKTVKIAKFQSGGLHDYYRNNNANGYGDTRIPQVPGSGTDFLNTANGFGYQKSAMRLVWEEFTLKCDRAAAFQVEKFDNEESGEQLVGLGVTEISRTVIVPEVDAYCFSTIASYCTPSLGNMVYETITNKAELSTGEQRPLKALNAAFLYFANHEVPVKDQIVFCSPDFINALRETNEVTKFLGQEDFKEGKDINFQIFNYQGRKLVETSPDRLRTQIELYGGGYKWAAGSLPINFLMVDKAAVIHVVKYEKVKVIGDDLNLAGQGFDGYTIFARIYHDVFVPDNKRMGLYCSAKGSGDPMAAKLDILGENGKVKAITTWPGEKIALVFKADAGTAVGATLASGSLVQVGDAIDYTKVYYSVVDGKVAAKLTPMSATTPDASHKMKVTLPISDPGVSYYAVAAAAAPSAVADSYTDIASGAEVTADDDYATYLVAHAGSTFLGTIKIADAY